MTWHRRTWVRSIPAIAAFAATVLLRGPLGDANEERRILQLRYTPDPDVVKLVAGAHRSSVADWVWLNAIADVAPSADVDLTDLPLAEQEKILAERKIRKKRWLDGAFELLTTLEPEFYTPYHYGATFLGLLEHDHQAAIDLLELGVANNPDSLQLRVDLAMAYFLYRNDREKTIEHLLIAAEHPYCDTFTLAFLTSLQVNEKADVPAIAKWTFYLDSPNEAVRTQATSGLFRTKFQIAWRAVREFTARNGTAPESVEQLRDPSLMDVEVMDVILEGLVLIDGKPRYPDLQGDTDRADKINKVEEWAARFKSETGSWPTLTDLENSELVELPEPPPGCRYELYQGQVNRVTDE